MIKNKRCYIAGKIGNLPKEEYEANFKNGKEEVYKLGYFPVSPIELPHSHNKTYSAYMKEDLTEMLKCDAVYCLSNWRHSPGATVEINLALFVGMEIIHQ